MKDIMPQIIYNMYTSYCFLIRFLHDLNIPWTERMSFNEFTKYASKILYEEINQ
jgi:hypothetical protein